ncbi:Rrp15p [Fragilaria crotonensis]|nr:Rrp15p [Fragilaria crotonensis]
MAKSKNKTKKVSLKRKAQEEAETGDLKRFAGSSDEEQNDDDDIEDDDNVDRDDEVDDLAVDENEIGEDDEYGVVMEDGERDEDHNDGEEADVEIEESDEEDAQRVQEEASGMANAMTRILGTQTKKGTASVVLSKTITPLQRLQKEEKERILAAKEKRKINRDRNLMALHIPLSVASSNATTTNTSNSLVNELELERTHRRVATRGVVALFNAIAQHQNDGQGGAEASQPTKDSKEVKKMTKHGFLDLIKTTAKESTTSSTTKANTNEVTQSTGSKPKWNALQDDYLLGSTLKDWDKESSDDDDDAADEPVDDTWDDDAPKDTKAVRTKKAPDTKKTKKVPAKGKSADKGKRRKGKK